jgi:transcription initiation factor TFIIIB Brf1 subunit/transcription initiation factor TFIIB
VDDSRLRELVGECRSQREIAAVFGVCPATIRTRMARLGLKPQTVSEGVRSAVLRGGGQAKLTEDKVVAMREDKRLGLSDRERASKYGVSKTAAREASDGETWGYIAIPVCAEIGGANA